MALMTKEEAKTLLCLFRNPASMVEKCYAVEGLCKFWEWETIEQGKGYCNLTDTGTVIKLQELIDNQNGGEG